MRYLSDKKKKIEEAEKLFEVDEDSDFPITEKKTKKEKILK